MLVILTGITSVFDGGGGGNTILADFNSIQFQFNLICFISHIIQKTFTMKIKFENMLSMRDVDAIKNA